MSSVRERNLFRIGHMITNGCLCLKMASDIRSDVHMDIFQPSTDSWFWYKVHRLLMRSTCSSDSKHGYFLNSWHTDISDIWYFLYNRTKAGHEISWKRSLNSPALWLRCLHTVRAAEVCPTAEVSSGSLGLQTGTACACLPGQHSAPSYSLLSARFHSLSGYKMLD